MNLITDLYETSARFMRHASALWDVPDKRGDAQEITDAANLMRDAAKALQAKMPAPEPEPNLL